jgi:hypothetical protein
MADYLIVRSTAGTPGTLTKADWRELIGREMAENEHLYEHALPLPDLLGTLFV